MSLDQTLDRQDCFVLRGGVYGHSSTLWDQDEYHSLIRGIQLAHEIVYTRQGVRAMTSALAATYMAPLRPSDPPPPPLAPSETIVDRDLAAKVLSWRRDNRTRIEVDADMVSYGRVDPSVPQVITIRWDLLRACAAARRRGPGSLLEHRAFVLQLAVVIVHELTHVMRLLYAPRKNTPPSLHHGCPAHLRRCYIDGEPRSVGEGGWWVERHLLGGEMRAVLADEASYPPGSGQWRCTGIIIQLYSPEPRWFALDAQTIHQVFEGERALSVDLEQLEHLIPFQPRHHLITGTNRQPRLRDFPAAPAPRYSLSAPVRVAADCPPTPPYHGAFGPRTCGYTGPGFLDDDDDDDEADFPPPVVDDDQEQASDDE